MNKNPYDVLGVSPDATDDEIKKAYRELSRKYHPDANVDNPLKDLAEEKFKEVQEAYDTILEAYKVAEDPDVMLPVMVNLDGFVLTHTFREPSSTKSLSDYCKGCGICATVCPFGAITVKEGGQP